MNEAGQGTIGPARGVVAAWLLAIAPAAMLAVLLLNPVWDVDIFWQLKLGELILARGGPVMQEPFAATHFGQPMPTFAWLGQAVMAQVRLVSGWTGLRIFDALCWLGGFLLVAAACRRRSGSAGAVLLALAIAFFAVLPLASIRPQSFAVLCFGALLALLRVGFKPWGMTVLAAPLFLLWQNLHPSVSIAAVALAAVAAVGWWRWLKHRSAPPWEQTVLSVLAGLTMFATPDGWHILSASAANAAASTAMNVNEWLPLWHPMNRFGAVHLLLIAVMGTWIVLRNPQRTDAGELAVAIVFFGMTLFASRFALFWALTLIPVIARAVPPPAAERRIPAWLSPLALIAVAALVPILRPTHFEEKIPFAAIEKLRASGVKGTIFAHFPWGGPAIDIGSPEWRVAYDGRYYRYSPEEWARYRAIGNGAVGVDEVERLYHPAGFVLSPEWNGRLIAELRAQPGRWRLLSSDRIAVVFQRKSGATP